MTTYEKGKLYDLPIIDLKADPNQPRKSMDLQALEDLAASIRLKGVIQPNTQDQLAVVIGKPRSTITESLSLTNLPLKVRDDCRGDRAVSKTRLIEIARKKQQRSMSSAYDKYKEELQKELAGVTKTREKLTPAAIFCQSLDKSREKVEKTDIADWSNDDLLAANDSISKLREALDNFTTPPSEGNLA
jgi:ParB family chromosome partitioning protein